MRHAILPLGEPGALDGLAPSYDLLIASLGYESRATYVAQVTYERCRRQVAAGFPGPKVLRHEANRRWYSRHGVATDDVPDHDYRTWILDQIRATPLREEGLRVLIDISSMSRVRIAECTSALWDWSGVVHADFLYALGKYDPPSRTEPPITVCQPVIPRLAGWSDEPGQPAAVVVGLGYEQDKAVGALEYLEPGFVWGFVPRGQDPRYASGVLDANASFWSFRPKPTRVEYDVIDPFGCFVTLESLAYGLAAERRPVIVPFGPKIFALSSVLVGLVHEPRVSVWRVSAGHLDRPVNRRASGRLVGLRVEIDNRRT